MLSLDFSVYKIYNYLILINGSHGSKERIFNRVA
jgi:hypothetical protein